ncbi:hypothetical protein EXIGLDRAFT_261583 [Exidia glandulosa HHB12029]|uniref:Uncharacterized protein n=1 Tax=Exidia glandulosa HHB12029 TaxID=1314781 RepID=A0A165DTJ9_EXIGL|nr:hypothetical protein EXIGLDRAFT_261583 [Exidia glandulosa HHB12029]
MTRWSLANAYPYAYLYDSSKKVTTSRTNIDSDGSVYGVKSTTPITQPVGCDHIVEIQILGDILQDSGYTTRLKLKAGKPQSVCELAKNMAPQDAAAKVRKIVGILNSAPNLQYFVTSKTSKLQPRRSSSVLERSTKRSTGRTQAQLPRPTSSGWRSTASSKILGRGLWILRNRSTKQSRRNLVAMPYVGWRPNGQDTSARSTLSLPPSGMT